MLSKTGPLFSPSLYVDFNPKGYLGHSNWTNCSLLAQVFGQQSKESVKLKDTTRRVADAFAARSHNLIKMPTMREMERLAKKLDDRFPGLQDCPMGIDGTQIEY